jgi:hypothetical protein
MPILQPGTGKVSFAIAANENIKGIIKADLKIVRTVSGIKLPVNCYKVEGENFGSWLVFNFYLILLFYFYYSVHILIYAL